MKTVIWCNMWNFARAFDTDGIGTKTHLTQAEGVEGKTLCGHYFPSDKGFPSSAGVCKRCLKMAGLSHADVRRLESVISVEY